MITKIQPGEKAHFDEVNSTLKILWAHSLSLWDNLKKSKVREDLFISVAVIAENPLNKIKSFKQDDFFKLS